MTRQLLAACSVALLFSAYILSGEEPTATPPALLPNGPTEKDYPSLHRLLQVTDRIYVGGEPHGSEAFRSLAELGIKTVVSVDGATPDVATAKMYGLRYVHIPIGYDGVDRNAGLALAQVMRECQGKVFFHCHHGQHRGPAAAAVACIADKQSDGTEALAILRKAGTGSQYPGLWRDVEKYQPPPANAQPVELMEIAKVDSLAAAMATLDRAADNLALCKEAGWQTPKDHPDVVVSTEATLLIEGFRESVRHLPPNADPQLVAWMRDAETVGNRLAEVIAAGDHTAASAVWTQVQTQCKQCHARFRN